MFFKPAIYSVFQFSKETEFAFNQFFNIRAMVACPKIDLISSFWFIVIFLYYCLLRPQPYVTRYCVNT